MNIFRRKNLYSDECVQSVFLFTDGEYWACQGRPGIKVKTMLQQCGKVKMSTFGFGIDKVLVDLAEACDGKYYT